MTKELYNEFYKKHGAGVHIDSVRFSEMANLCKGKVLDIGCGAGDLADFYRGNYTGVDISDVGIEMAKKTKRKDANFLVDDVLKSVSGFFYGFDTIVMAEFLEHIKDDEELLKNIKKCANPNTRLVISVPNGDRVPDPTHLREFTVPELRRKFSQFGKVKFYNWVGFEKRILLTVDFGEVSEDLISLVMIVWNEALGLERAILSSVEFVNNIVLSVDNKSDDGTLKIAERYADVLKKHEWKNDFAGARNTANEGVKSKWIFSLDGHEYVEAHPGIEEMLKSDEECLMVKMKMDEGDNFPSPKIFRSSIPWKHAIHNAITCKTLKKYSDFLIIHDRKGGQGKLAVKKRLNQVKETMELELKKELKQKGNKVRALFYLARYHRQFGEWKKAIKYYIRYLKIGRHKGEMWLASYEAGIIANGLGKHLKALEFFRQAEKLLPNRWETAKHFGLTYMSFEQWEKAADFLVNSFKINTGEFSFNPEEKDDADTWDKIGYCFFQLKKYREAKVAWEEAIEKEEDPDKIKLNLKRIELMDRKLIV